MNAPDDTSSNEPPHKPTNGKVYTGEVYAHVIGLIFTCLLIIAGIAMLLICMSSEVAHFSTTDSKCDASQVSTTANNNDIPDDLESAMALNLAAKARSIEIETDLIKRKFTLVAVTLFIGLLFGCLGFTLFLLGVVGNSNLSLNHENTAFQITNIF